MKKDTLIFMGRSGSGKGTQIKLLKSYLSDIYPDEKVLHFESGDGFRSLVKDEGYTNDRIREIIAKGELVPDFITEWLLTDFLVKNMETETFSIFDGFPRTLKQAKTMDDIIDYYQLPNVKIIDVSVSEDEVRRRMLARGRGDDQLDVINKRIEWYNTNVLPVIQYFKENENYKVLSINGEQSIDGVFQEIKEKLNYE